MGENKEGGGSFPLPARWSRRCAPHASDCTGRAAAPGESSLLRIPRDPRALHQACREGCFSLGEAQRAARLGEDKKKYTPPSD